MSDEDPVVAGRRRTRGAAAAARSDAIERLKALRSGRRREMDSGGFQIKMEQPIYDTVDDDEYEALVAKRREEARGFIIDDNGLGYGDEGQEEDWSIAGRSLSSDESEGESERSKKKKKVSNSEKKEKETTKKPSALASAAAMMGKQRISSMFTSSVFKKDIQKNVSCDSIVDDVIAEFAPDENDRERRRRGNSSNLGLNKSSNFASSSAIGVLPVNIEKPVAISCTIKNDIHEITSGGGHLDVDHSEKNKDIIDGGNSTISTENGFNGTEMIRNEETKGTDEAVKNVKTDFLVSKSEEEEVEKKVYSLNAKTEGAKNSALSASAAWEAVSAGIVDCKGQEAISEDKLDFELDYDGSLPFYLLDAHEEFYGANAGKVYLFGKVCYTFHSPDCVFFSLQFWASLQLILKRCGI